MDPLQCDEVHYELFKINIQFSIITWISSYWYYLHILIILIKLSSPLNEQAEIVILSILSSNAATE